MAGMARTANDMELTLADDQGSSLWPIPLKMVLPVAGSVDAIEKLIRTGGLQAFRSQNQRLFFDPTQVVTAFIRPASRSEALRMLHEETRGIEQREPIRSLRRIFKELSRNFPAMTYQKLLALAHKRRIPVDPKPGSGVVRFRGRVSDVQRALEKMGSRPWSDAEDFAQTHEVIGALEQQMSRMFLVPPKERPHAET
jgi:hypothetical protein